MGNRSVSVTIYGPTLSHLIHENINSKNEQEGFLLGTINTTIEKSVTDTDREQVKVKEEITITGVLPCDIPNSFYHPTGEIIKEKLNKILGKHKENVVSWFRYKKFRKIGFKFTIRERALHEELSNYLNINPSLFTCCLLTNSHSANKSTLIFSHAFVNMYANKFRIVNLHIKNLGDRCHVYQPNMKPSDTFMKLYNVIKKDQPDAELGKAISDGMKKELSKSIVKLETRERKLFELKREVEELRKIIRNKVFESNKLPSTSLENEPLPELKELQINVPISPEPVSKSSPEASQVQDNELSSSTAVVDLTFEDDDDVVEDVKPRTRLRNGRK